MSIRLMLIAGLTTLGALTVLASPVQGGIILIGGEGGTTDPPSPTTGANSEEDWNPTVTCSVGEGQGIFDLLYCLQDEISNPPPPCLASNTGTSGLTPVRVRPRVLDDPPIPCFSYTQLREDFNVWVIQPPPDQWGIEIRKIEGDAEINRLTFRENDPGIQTTELLLDATATGRVARIRLVEETPGGAGMVSITVNNTNVSVSTSTFQTPSAINAEIIRQLGVPFSVTVAGAYLHVKIRSGMGDGIHQVQFRSTDTGIISSDLSLLPNDDQVLLADQQPVIQ